MPRILKSRPPATENASNTVAATPQPRRAVRDRCSSVWFEVMAKNAGTAAKGSTITNSELAASRMYSRRLIKSVLIPPETGGIGSQEKKPRSGISHGCEHFFPVPALQILMGIFV